MHCKMCEGSGDSIVECRLDDVILTGRDVHSSVRHDH